MNAAIPISEGIFTSLDPNKTRLIGSLCSSCGHHVFPALAACPRCCGRSIEKVELHRRGTLWTWTKQCFMPPSPPYDGPESAPEQFQPFFLGMVELPGQCRVMSRLLFEDETSIGIGMPLELTLFTYAQSSKGVSRVAYAFRPVAQDAC
jgi:uncharacterized OB-fold protein